MLSDIQIAHSSEIKPIYEIALDIGLNQAELELYGKYKAKINDSAFQRLKNKNDGKLILVTAISPTPAGEGKTTMSIGLGQAMKMEGKSVVIALREPSMGPVFGIKGGATGGGYSQAIPMEDINLHFTGDIHAITSANNLLCATVDNHIYHGNRLGIDPRKIQIKRCMDMNDRELRKTVIGIGGITGGMPREDGFVITAASEVMAILCLSSDINDLKTRLGNILIGYTFDNRPVFAKQLSVDGAMTALLKDAINPNLVQTIKGCPVIMHGGPFANIAHGCNSIRATKLAMKLSDYCITEAGFGADLGAEKFIDIKCRMYGLKPCAIVIAATIRALKYNGGCKLKDLDYPNIDDLKKGIGNLQRHIENIKKFGAPLIVALNLFYSDSSEEIKFVEEYCKKMGVAFSTSDAFSKGGKGSINLARMVCELANEESDIKYPYSDDMDIKDKIFAICHNIYGADGVIYSKAAETQIERIKALGRHNLPVCIAKTQYSFSDDPLALGMPSGFTIHVSNISLSNGAGFIVVYTGDIVTMPGLPISPAACNIDVDEGKRVTGMS